MRSSDCLEGSPIRCGSSSRRDPNGVIRPRWNLVPVGVGTNLRPVINLAPPPAPVKAADGFATRPMRREGGGMEEGGCLVLPSPRAVEDGANAGRVASRKGKNIPRFVRWDAG